MHTVKAIILKSIPHSEQQQILHVYSEERGYMQMITPLALFKRKTNTSVQCMQIVEIEFIPNERGGLHKLKSLSPLVNTSAIQTISQMKTVPTVINEIREQISRITGK